MAAARLTIDTLGDLDEGAARVIINQEIQTVVSDLEDRGQDGLARTVTIKVEMAYVKGNILTNVTAKGAIPARRSNSTVGKIRFFESVPRLLFQEHAGENPDQQTFPEMDTPKTERKTDAEGAV